MTTIKIGDVVTWRAAGKVARCDGVNGQLVTGTVTAVHLDDEVFGPSVTVEGHYTSLVPLHRVPLSKLIARAPKRPRTLAQRARIPVKSGRPVKASK